MPAARQFLRVSAVGILAAAAVAAQASPAHGAPAEVRVHIASGSVIAVSGAGLHYRGERERGRADKVWVKAAGKGLSIAGQPDAGPIEIETDEIFTLGKRRYRGRLRVYAEGGRAHAVNVVAIEEYLASVLGSEMGAAWPPEALKAQAVVARSYVVARMAKSKHRRFDVDATVLSQVYTGVRSEAKTTRAAVAATRGLVLKGGGAVIEAYFHSSCGGRTEDGRALWGDGVGFMSSVKDPYCEAAPAYFWTYRIASDELGRRTRLPPVGVVKILDRAPGGRALEVSFEAAGRRKTLSGDEVRRALGYDKLKSTLFHVSTAGTDFVFKGSGAGHGVGMCQWGARGQAEQGRGYEKILRFYFPTARIGRL